MMQRFSAFTCTLTIVLGWFSSCLQAQILTPGGGTTTPTATTPILTPDPGTIISAPSTDPQRVKCWVSRNFDTALAACVYTDSVYQVPMANIRLYQLSGSGFVGKQVTFKEVLTGGAAESYTFDVLNVRLEKVDDSIGRVRYYEMAYYPKGYNANGTGRDPRVLVGYARFAPGKNGRATSDAIFRLHKKIQQALGGSLPLAAPAGTAASSSSDPCDGPPVDDIGEEEETVAGAPLTPGPALNLKP